jgi:tetratricopeptide (TPR) repeat protein
VKVSANSFLAVLLSCVFLFSTLPAYSLGQAEEQIELKYAEGLIDLGLPGYADKVLEKLGTSPQTKVLKIKSFLLAGQFDKARQIIGNEPDQNSRSVWQMKLALADSYFAYVRYAEAKGIYESFFNAYKENPPADILPFFVESSYRYAQIMLGMNDRQAAIDAYRRAINSSPPKHIERQIAAELGELMLTQAENSDESKRADTLSEVERLADKLLWVQDVWYGKGLVLKAHIAFLKGDAEGAMKLVEDFKPQLIAIDKQLRDQNLTQLSPMAQVRYLVGFMALGEAKRKLEEGGNRAEIQALLIGREEKAVRKKPRNIAGAAQHFLNVFVRYPDTPWAPDAGLRFEETKRIVEEEFGRTLSFRVTDEQWRKVAENQFRQAKALLDQLQYKEAAERYRVVANRFPESLSIVGGLSDLALCYIELADELRVDTVIHYLAERFNKNKKLSDRAGNAILNIADICREKGREDRYDAVCDVFFKNFTTHPLAARRLYSAGNKRYADGDIEGALKYLEKVVSDHANAPISYDAMSRIASAYNEVGEKEKEVKALKSYTKKMIADNRISHDLITGLYRLGSAYRQLGSKYYPSAINRYKEIIKRMSEGPEKYTTSKQEADKNQEILEAATFYKAYCYAKLPSPENKPEGVYKQAAIRMYADLEKTFPKSPRAPQALSQAGTLWTVLREPVKAQQVFRSLKEKYPRSPEAQNVDFLLAMSLMDIGMRNDAIELLKKMFAGNSTYSLGQILPAANELFKAGEYEIAVNAYDRVFAAGGDRAYNEAALAGKGRALVALEEYEDGAKTLEKLFQEYPRTSFTVDATYDLSRALARLAAGESDAEKRRDIFNKSIVAMQKVLNYDPQRRGQVNVEVARIQELKAEAERNGGNVASADRFRNEAIAAYQTVILFEDAQDANVRPHLEDAFHACIRLFLEAEQWQDAFDDANEYLKVFRDPKYEAEVRSWRSKAAAKLKTMDSPGMPVPGAEGGIAPTETGKTAG